MDIKRSGIICADDNNSRRKRATRELEFQKRKQKTSNAIIGGSSRIGIKKCKNKTIKRPNTIIGSLPCRIENKNAKQTNNKTSNTSIEGLSSRKRIEPAQKSCGYVPDKDGQQ
jgi:hypothetical protein